MQPARDTLSACRPSEATGPDFATDIKSDMVNEACARIYKSWLRFVPHHEALEQAQHFAQRFETLKVCHFLTETELDQVLETVADAMADAS